MQFFDPTQEFAIIERRLPHWSQAGTVTFLTWRTCDSMPEHVIKNWQCERAEWLRCRGCDPDRSDWEARLNSKGLEIVRNFRRFHFERWNDYLDGCHGECVLKRPELSAIVANSLRHFDGDRYQLTDFVVMPNHVHILVAFPTESAMLFQCTSWKRFTARAINQVLGRQGHFWQEDGFDHLVRSEVQFEALRQYIAENPCKAGLRPVEYTANSSRNR